MMILDCIREADFWVALVKFARYSMDISTRCEPLTMCSDSEICQLAELMGVDCAELRGMNRTEQENALKENVAETTFDNYDALGIFVSRKFDVIKRCLPLSASDSRPTPCTTAELREVAVSLQTASPPGYGGIRLGLSTQEMIGCLAF